MTGEKVKRKLTAILSADVKGYSRLMGLDEVGTIRSRRKEDNNSAGKPVDY
jgi:adenylate cyclase